MCTKWQNFISVGNSCKQLNSESFNRAAIGRYYYAAFNIAYAFLKGRRLYSRGMVTTNGVTRNKTQHENTQDCLATILPAEALKLGSLRKLRNRCDYVHNFAPTPQQVDDAKADAESIITAIMVRNGGQLPAAVN